MFHRRRHTLYNNTDEPSLSQEASRLSKNGEESPMRAHIDFDDVRIMHNERRRDDADADYLPSQDAPSSSPFEPLSRNHARKRTMSRHFPSSQEDYDDVECNDDAVDDPDEDYRPSQQQQGSSPEIPFVDLRDTFPRHKLDGHKLLSIIEVYVKVYKKNPHQFAIIKGTIKVLYGLTETDAEKAWYFCKDREDVLQDADDMRMRERSLQNEAEEEWPLLLQPRM